MEKKPPMARKIEELERKVRLLEQRVDDLARRIDEAGHDLASRRGPGPPGAAERARAADGPPVRYDIGDREYLPVIMP
jgi:hypothetical protein